MSTLRVDNIKSRTGTVVTVPETNTLAVTGIVSVTSTGSITNAGNLTNSGNFTNTGNLTVTGNLNATAGVITASNLNVTNTLTLADAQVGGALTVTGNLTVNGTTTTLSTTNTVVSDRLLELANGTTGSPTADSGIVIERGSETNIFIGYDEGLDLFVTGTTQGTGSSTDISPTPIAVLCGALKITDSAGTNEFVINYLSAQGAPDGATAGRYLQNITVDAGTY